MLQQTTKSTNQTQPKVATTNAGDREELSEVEHQSVQPIGIWHRFGNLPVQVDAVPAIIQPKLTINHPDDPFEQEADRMAEQVMRMPESNSSGNPIPLLSNQAIQRKCTTCGGELEEEQEDRSKTLMRKAIPDTIQRKCAACEAMKDEENKTLMRKAAGFGGYEASPSLSSQLSRSKGGGAPLPESTRSVMEGAFQTDFSRVRVHTDAQAAEMSWGIQARAFTHGWDIYFDQGEFAPERSEGKRLLAHELTHTIQQSGGNSNQLGSNSKVSAVNSGSIISRGDRDAVDRTRTLGNTLGTGIQFWPRNFVDTRVGPVSVQGGLLSTGTAQLHVIIGENLTPRTLARQILPLWTTATPFTPPGGVQVPLDVIDEETLAKGLLVYNQYYLPVPAMTAWRSGLRFPLPAEVDEASGIVTLHPTLIRNLATAFDVSWTPLLDSRATANTTPPAATLAADVAAFLVRESSALARGMHLAARSLTNAAAEMPFVEEVLNQVSQAERFEIALAFMDSLVNREVALLTSQNDGLLIIFLITNALANDAPATPTPEQQASIDRANTMMTVPLNNMPPPIATRTRAEKTITVDTVKLDGSTHNPATQIAIANAIYSQCNVRILHGVDATATPAQTTGWLGGNTDLRSLNNCHQTSVEEQSLFSAAPAAFNFNNRFQAFFVASVSGVNASGYSCPPATTPTALFRNKIIVNNSGSTDTFAHELGHHLINPGPHTAGTVMGVRPRPSLRLTDRQCNRVYQNA